MASKSVLWILLIAGIYSDWRIRDHTENFLYWPLCEFAALMAWFLIYSFIVARHVTREKRAESERQMQQQGQPKKGGLLATFAHLRKRADSDSGQKIVNERPSHEMKRRKKDANRR